MVCDAGNRSDLNPVVYVKDGEVFARSTDVAAYFGRRHDNVMDAIRQILADACELIPENSGVRFISTTYAAKTGFGARQLPCFEMTKDAFALLVMGFTGKDALRFKLAYINRFNEMEAALRQPVAPALPDFSNPAVAARAWAFEYEARLRAGKTTKDYPTL